MSVLHGEKYCWHSAGKKNSSPLKTNYPLWKFLVLGKGFFHVFYHYALYKNCSIFYKEHKVRKMTEEIASILANAAIPSSTTFIPYRYSDDDKSILEIIDEVNKIAVPSSLAIKFFQLMRAIPHALQVDGHSNDETLYSTALLSISMSESPKIIALTSQKDNNLTVQEISILKKTIENAILNQADYITAFIPLK
ncbi:hypothetical protein [Pectobacterium brasiliense]|uniref:hypothetical protein n=1 Tax=Pectobacterium brasiliense TaxID=180957 RepID=UPI0019694772|nr:hypothetical protein [Pectobacterium brasiliense]MBN3171740.1 hypothetical protein [Pectobacterium brasiliense]